MKQVNTRYKINEIVNKFLLAGDSFMTEMQLRLPGFMRGTFGPFTKNKQRIQKFKGNGNSRYIYQNKLDKACFQQGDFKDLTTRKCSDKILLDKAFDIRKNAKYDGYQRGLASMVCKFFDKKTSGSAIENENISNKRPLDFVIS